ncbi:MAG TPA: PHP domain-containing protein [Burkholderiales bacterium]|nr:PHP domain-containing protein [Burkholderiales bacterium]
MHSDLHTHSTCSDGVLAPAALVRRAASRHVCVLALTDHDDVSGLEEAGAEAGVLGVRLVPGVEISVTWSGQGIHVLGLGIDPCERGLVRGLAMQRGDRASRAAKIAARFDAMGIAGTLDGAAACAGSSRNIGRNHFARLLVERGLCRDGQEAFRRYLGAGKAAFVPHEWAALGEAIEWIRGAGGYAVLAHPERYKLSGARLRGLLREFRALGGEGLEIGVASRLNPLPMLRLAAAFGLAASTGSDFHAPVNGGVDLGDTARIGPGHARVRDLPEDLPVAA